MTSATIVIPSRNGRPMLERCLPALQQAIAAAGGNHSILVVDDGSTDDTAEFVSTTFPSVELVRIRKNGFARACNTGVLRAQTEAVVLLNNDIVVESDFLPPLLDALQETGVFAVSAKFLDPEGSLENVLGNRTRAVWKQGLLEIVHEMEPTRLTTRGPQFYTQGGAMACWRRTFIDLGGFDTLYEPFYWEDVDLSYRAWKRGLKILYEPNAVCRHYQSATTARDYSARYLRQVSLRNSYLFLWKNLTEARLLAKHLAHIPLRAARDILLTGREMEYAALLGALRKLREAAARRVIERSFAVISDSEVMRQANG